MGACQSRPPLRPRHAAATATAVLALAVAASGCATGGKGRSPGAPQGNEEAAAEAPTPVAADEAAPEPPEFEPEAAVHGNAATAGSVRFVGFDDGRLVADFRLIPEEGVALAPPVAGEVAAVDGFWWRFAPRRTWFKIPNHCHVDVIADPSAGPEPSAFRVRPDCDPFASAVLRATGRVAEAGFVPDAGATAHPSEDPFAGVPGAAGRGP